MTRTPPLLLLPAVCALLACGPPLDGTRLVLLDESARVAGVQVQLDRWEGAPAFAIRLTPDDHPLLLTQTDARRLEVPVHALALVEGAEAQVRILDLERDVARDALAVTGSEGAAQRVAKLLDAQLTPLDGDRYQLSGPELLDRSAFLEAPRGLREVRAIETAPDEVRSILGRGGSGPSLAGSGGAPGEAEDVPLSLVGVYAGGQWTLVLDAEGSFTLVRDCGEPVHGTAVLEGDRLTLLEERQRPRLLHWREDGTLEFGGEILNVVEDETP